MAVRVLDERLRGALRTGEGRQGGKREKGEGEMAAVNNGIFPFLSLPLSFARPSLRRTFFGGAAEGAERRRAGAAAVDAAAGGAMADEAGWEGGGRREGWMAGMGGLGEEVNCRFVRRCGAFVLRVSETQRRRWRASAHAA